MPAAIEINELRKTYEGNVHAVRGISLSIAEGSFFGFLGPNGAGKSTTIQMLCGLTDPTSGTIRVFGKDVKKHYVECRKRIGVGLQEFHFDRFFSIRKILEFQGGYFGLTKSFSAKRSEELLKQFDLWDQRKKKAPKLSGGQKRRLQIAKALVHDPDILILDEPTAGIDVELRIEFWDLLKDLNKQGKTILLTTHYLEEAEKLCEDLAIIHQGVIVEGGKKSDILKMHNAKLEDVFLNLVRTKEKVARV